MTLPTPLAAAFAALALAPRRVEHPPLRTVPDAHAALSSAILASDGTRVILVVTGKGRPDRPARILGVPAGSLAVGEAADVCIFDAEAMQRVSADTLKSQGKNTPFLGHELPGRVRYTLLGGQVVYEG